MVPGNMNLFNSDISMRNRSGDHILQNTRAITTTSGPTQYYSPEQMGVKTTGDNTLYSNIQIDRNSPEILDALKQNPYNLSITGNQNSPWKMSAVS
jgi:hypothetical protein